MGRPRRKIVEQAIAALRDDEMRMLQRDDGDDGDDIDFDHEAVIRALQWAAGIPFDEPGSVWVDHFFGESTSDLSGS